MRNLSILVVDDEEDTRLSVAQFLAGEFPGCRIVTADDGQGAMEAIDRTRFDLAIIDYRLPYANGLEVARYAARTSRVPCVLLTGVSDPSIAARGELEGILVGTLHKTASYEEIKTFLRNALEKTRRSP